MADKIYVGSAKKVTTQYGEITELLCWEDDINKIVKWMKDEGSKSVRISIMEKKSPAEGKPTHYAVINEWKPQQQGNQEYRPAKPGGKEPDGIDVSKHDDGGDLPF